MSSDRTGVLLVEDDQNIVDLVRSNLMARGHEVTVSKDGSDAVALLESVEPEMVILDLMLPGIDGFELCREIRERSSVGIVVLSARRAETDKVRALNLGADDYMTKPFGTAELQARVRAHLRRAHLSGRNHADSVIRAGALCIDLAKRSVRRDDVLVHLTPIEWELLRVLAINAGRTLTHQQLFRQVWTRSHGDAQHYLRVHVANLRRKLEQDAVRPRHIVTEPGVGYRFTADG